VPARSGVAGIPVRHPGMVALGRHYGCTVQTCVPFDPESKGGVEAAVKIAKADLVPSDANLLPAYRSFAALEEACREFCGRVNGRVHRETAAVPAARLAAIGSAVHDRAAAFREDRLRTWVQLEPIQTAAPP
jgi:transposase